MFNISGISIIKRADKHVQSIHLNISNNNIFTCCKNNNNNNNLISFIFEINVIKSVKPTYVPLAFSIYYALRKTSLFTNNIIMGDTYVKYKLF